MAWYRACFRTRNKGGNTMLRPRLTSSCRSPCCSLRPRSLRLRRSEPFRAHPDDLVQLRRQIDGDEDRRSSTSTSKPPTARRSASPSAFRWARGCSSSSWPAGRRPSSSSTKACSAASFGVADFDVTYYHVGGLFAFGTGQIHPFVVSPPASPSSTRRSAGPRPRRAFSGSFGGGVKIFFNDHVGARFEGRGFWTVLDDYDDYDYDYATAAAITATTPASRRPRCPPA